MTDGMARAAGSETADAAAGSKAADAADADADADADAADSARPAATGASAQAESTGARERLLAEAQRMLMERGRLSDLSLRGLAEQLGTMLIYHFGSRDGLLAALLVELSRQERRALLERGDGVGLAEALHGLEEAYIDPAHGARTTAFFYVLGLAAQDPETYREFLASIDAWIELFTVLGMREGRGRESAHARAHAVVWAARGAMFQALATGERSAALRGFRQVLVELGVTRG
jgi:hypothetical protein